MLQYKAVKTLIDNIAGSLYSGGYLVIRDNVHPDRDVVIAEIPGELYLYVYANKTYEKLFEDCDMKAVINEVIAGSKDEIHQRVYVVTSKKADVDRTAIKAVTTKLRDLTKKPAAPNKECEDHSNESQKESQQSSIQSKQPSGNAQETGKDAKLYRQQYDGMYQGVSHSDQTSQASVEEKLYLEETMEITRQGF
jgi:hypothetical protein